MTRVCLQCGRTFVGRGAQKRLNNHRRIDHRERGA